MQTQNLHQGGFHYNHPDLTNSGYIRYMYRKKKLSRVIVRPLLFGNHIKGAQKEFHERVEHRGWQTHKSRIEAYRPDISETTTERTLKELIDIDDGYIKELRFLV